jgi:hypothetical protein
MALDSQKTQAQRNKLGQFATPPSLAGEITRFSAELASPLGDDASALEPSCGTGAFLTALSDCPATSSVAKVGVEVDALFADAAKRLWGDEAQIINADFLEWAADLSSGFFDLLVANPPYVRHHHLTSEQKSRYAEIASQASGQSPSGLSGLYVYFVLAAASRLRADAVASWLIPTEFMSVNYGSALRSYLTTRATLERVHVFRAEDVQFDDALVTSCVVTYRNTPPSSVHSALFTFGSSFEHPSEEHRVPVAELRRSPKWLQRFQQSERGQGMVVGQCFTIRRGIATGGNSFFIRPRAEFHALGIGDDFLRPILPSPRHMPATEIEADAEGWPTNVATLALLDCTGKTWESLPVSVQGYLSDVPHKIRDSYLVKGRSPWYVQEQREAAPIVCTYMGRSRSGESAFRFIRNRSRAITTNSYLMLFPKVAGVPVEEDWLDEAWHKLAEVPLATMQAEGREYGGGLKKIEPKELARVVIPDFDAASQGALF